MVLKFTKGALRLEQMRLRQLETYLPTLSLKKSLLQMELESLKGEMQKLNARFQAAKEKVENFSYLLTSKSRFSLMEYTKVCQVSKTYENVAGVEIPKFESVIFPESSYHLFDTPIWADTAIETVRNLLELKEREGVLFENKRALEKELREVSIRVNLFEKVLIPRCRKNIKQIRIFLGDQQLAAVAQAKVAKCKILKRQKSVRL